MFNLYQFLSLAILIAIVQCQDFQLQPTVTITQKIPQMVITSMVTLKNDPKKNNKCLEKNSPHNLLHLNTDEENHFPPNLIQIDERRKKPTSSKQPRPICHTFRPRHSSPNELLNQILSVLGNGEACVQNENFDYNNYNQDNMIQGYYPEYVIDGGNNVNGEALINNNVNNNLAADAGNVVAEEQIVNVNGGVEEQIVNVNGGVEEQIVNVNGGVEEQIVNVNGGVEEQIVNVNVVTEEQIANVNGDAGNLVVIEQEGNANLDNLGSTATTNAESGTGIDYLYYDTGSVPITPSSAPEYTLVEDQNSNGLLDQFSSWTVSSSTGYMNTTTTTKRTKASTTTEESDSMAFSEFNSYLFGISGFVGSLLLLLFINV